MNNHAYTVTYACGTGASPHTRIIYLPGSASVVTVEETLKLLSKSWCPACHRGQRQRDARHYSHAFGLTPLASSNSHQLALAEIVRASFLELFVTSQADTEAIAILISLINRCVEADFWIEHRAILWDRRRIGDILIDLLVYKHP